MKLHELQPAIGSTTAPKRLGRGVGSGLGKTSGKGHKGAKARSGGGKRPGFEGGGLGKTSGKGHKGAKARSGGGKRPGFEGGQMPLTRRIPKRGFTNIYAKEYATVNVGSLEIFEDGTVVTVALLKEAGLVKQVRDGVKILGGGELTKKLTVQVTKFTQSAKEKIEAVGGKAEVI